MWLCVSRPQYSRHFAPVRHSEFQIHMLLSYDDSVTGFENFLFDTSIVYTTPSEQPCTNHNPIVPTVLCGEFHTLNYTPLYSLLPPATLYCVLCVLLSKFIKGKCSGNADPIMIHNAHCVVKEAHITNTIPWI